MPRTLTMPIVIDHDEDNRCFHARVDLPGHGPFLLATVSECAWGKPGVTVAFEALVLAAFRALVAQVAPGATVLDKISRTGLHEMQ